MINFNSIWKDEQDKERRIYVSERVRGFFNNLQVYGLEPRIGQKIMAINVCNSITQSNLLIQSAGVGIGKSFAYLIPIFYLLDEYESQGKELGPVIISTSSIALQKQLLDDIAFIKSILQLDKDITYSISLGMNNYACLKRVQSAIANKNNSKEEIKILKQLLKLIKEKQTSEISTFDLNLKEYLKNQIKVRYQECIKCRYTVGCPFAKTIKSITRSNIIITNHGQLANWSANSNPILKKASAIVIDEAHHFEELVRSSNEETIKLEDIMQALRCLELNYNEHKSIIELAKNFFVQIKKNTKNDDIDKNQENNIVDISNTELQKTAAILCLKLKDYQKRFTKTQRFSEEFSKETLLRVIDFCEEIAKGDTKYLYSSKFYRSDNWVIVKRSAKDLGNIVHKIVDNRPTIITSATLPQNLLEDLNINDVPHQLAAHLPTPYPFEKNAVFYPVKNMPEPPTTRQIRKRDKVYTEYISALAKRIDTQIDISEGKTLVLFTSKKIAYDVYSRVKETRKKSNINLIIQDDDTEKHIKNFKNDINSVLFSYGLWEGMNIPGEALSQVIITRLPFPVVTPLLQYKSSKYSDTEIMNQVYTPEMILKLIQGLGRGIRNIDDKCAFICLDGRYSKYQRDISQALNTYFPGVKTIGNNGPVKKLINSHINPTSTTKK
jgi:ATP-dependent DNA helicase DinG